MKTPNFSNFATSPLFSGLTTACLGHLYQQGTILTLTADETLIEEGQPNESLYVVLRGVLRVILSRRGGRFAEVRMGSLGPGDCIGEYSLLDCQPASATIIAVNPATVLRFSASELESLLTAHPGIGCIVHRNLLELLIGRLRTNDAELDLFQPAWQIPEEPVETTDRLAWIY